MRAMVIIIAFVIGSSVASSPYAQDFPARPVQVVEPFGAGAGVDVMARIVAQKLSELWGQAVAVENRPGEGGTLAPALVAKSPADGYTLLMNSSAQASSAAMSLKLPYDPVNDFIPIAAITRQPYVLITGQPTDVKSVRELVAAAQAKPGEFKFGSAGAGTGTHLAAEKFNADAGIKAVHTPMKPAEVMAETIAGRITYWLAPIALALPNVRDGKVVGLGMSTATRSSIFPDLPTISEAGIPGYDYAIWYGLWAPAGTPTAILDKVAMDVARVLAMPDVRDRLGKHGAEPMSMTRPEFARFVSAEIEGAAKLIKSAGIKGN